MGSTTQSPNWREILSARSSITGSQEYLSSTNGALNVVSSGGSTTPTVSSIVSGQQTATGTAAALTSNSLKQGLTVQALSTNTVSVFIGASGVTSSTGLELPAGASVTLPVNNSNVVYIVAASSSPVVTFVGA